MTAGSQELIDSAHSHGLKILFDLVINHCSDQHAWFQESRQDKTNPKRDWFHWKPPRHDGNGGEWDVLLRDAHRGFSRGVYLQELGDFPTDYTFPQP